jgi:hypothetical protein
MEGDVFTNDHICSTFDKNFARFRMAFHHHHEEAVSVRHPD